MFAYSLTALRLSSGKDVYVRSGLAVTRLRAARAKCTASFSFCLRLYYIMYVCTMTIYMGAVLLVSVVCRAHHPSVLYPLVALLTSH